MINALLGFAAGIFKLFLFLCLVYAILILNLGFMFVMRVCIKLWFDVDFMDKVKRWFNG